MLQELSAIIPEIIKIREENRVHLLRDVTNNHLVTSKRPAESEIVRKWRIENYRLINHEIFETYLRQIKELLMDEVLNAENGSEKLKLEVKEYSSKLIRFYCDEVLFLSILDPNSVTVIIPKKTENQNLNEYAELEWYNVPTERIKYQSGRFFIQSEKRVKIGDKEDYTYYSFDHNTIYFHYTGNDNKLTEEVYYEHNLGRYPFVNMPSDIVISSRGIKYRESSFKTTTGYLNEFVCSFTDDQWMRNKNNYSTFYTPPITCSACKGEMYITDSAGNKTTCKSCDGTGKQKSPGLSDIIILPAVSYDDKLDTRVPGYIEPGSAHLIHSWDKTFELLDKAAATLGINPLIKTSESGEAMKMRMKKWESTANYAYNKYLEYFVDFLTIMEGYYNYEPEKREDNIRISRIDNILKKNVEYLRESAITALPFEKKQSAIEYINRKYADNLALRKLYVFIAINYPVLLLSEEEIKNRIAFGLISEEDIRTASDYESRAIKRIYQDYDYILNASDEQLAGL